MSSCSSEARIVWEILPQDTKDEICALLLAQQSKQQRSVGLMSQLDAVCSQLFVASKEAHVMRRLCVFLGYLTTAEFDFLSAAEDVSTVRQYEGDTGNMELLHTCSEVGGMTKYQYLFTFEERALCFRRFF